MSTAKKPATTNTKNNNNGSCGCGTIILIVAVVIFLISRMGASSSGTSHSSGTGKTPSTNKTTVTTATPAPSKEYGEEDLGFLAVCCCEQAEGCTPDQVYVYVDDYPTSVTIEMKVENEYGGESMLMQLVTDSKGNARDPIMDKNYNLGDYEYKLSSMRQQWPRDWAYHLVKNGEIAG